LCPTGLELDRTGKMCKDINECAVSNGGCEQICLNSDGSYFCSCNYGFVPHLNGMQCLDVDECIVGNGDCSHECINLPGTYECNCPKNLTLDDDGYTCQEILTCDRKNGGCQHICSYTEAYQVVCSCQSGWTLDSDGYSCSDIDECIHASNGNCEHECFNTPGSWECRCDTGYQPRKDDPSRVNQYVLLRVRTTEYVLLLIPASVHPVTLVLNAQLFAFQPVLMEEFANETTFVYVQRDGPVKRAEQRRATHLALTEDVVLPLTNVSVHCHTLVHNVKDLTAVQSVRTEGRVLDVINVLVCKTGVGALVHNGSLRMNVLRRAKTMEHVLETINVIAKLVSMENYVRKRC